MRAVNLIPDDRRPGAGGRFGRSEGAAYLFIAVLGGLVAMSLLYVSSHHQIADRRAQAARLAAQASTAQASAGALAPYGAFLSLRDQRLQAVQQLAGSRFDWAHAVHELGRVLPYDVSLTSVSGTISAPAVGDTVAGPAVATATTSAVSATQSATPPGSTPQVTISGCTTSQSEVAVTMQRLALMDGVTGVNLISATEGTAGATVGTSGDTSACATDFQAAINYSPLPTVTAGGSAIVDDGAPLAATPAFSAPTTGGGR